MFWFSWILLIYSKLLMQPIKGEPFWVNLTSKSTWQSSDYYSKWGILHTSELAVDGCKDPVFRNGCCSHTTAHTDPAPWWSVDLGQMYTFVAVNLTNREENGIRLDDFSVFGSNVTYNLSQDDNKDLCIDITTPLADGATQTFSCVQLVTARYLIIQKRFHILTLCEVELQADCPYSYYNKFGTDCTPCSEHCAITPCNSSSGYCVGGCQPGYTGDDCMQECKDGSYGYNCEKCPANCLTSSCQKFSVNGRCSDGCKPGYIGDNCTEECEDGTYGYGCKLCSPNCLTPPCQKFSVDGACTGGCNPGYIGENCSQECPSGTYGLKCLTDCFGNCKGSCDIISGVCRNGCTDGWTGKHCDIEKAEPSSTSHSTEPYLIGVAVAVCIIVTLVVTTAIFCCLWRHKNQGPNHLGHEGLKTEMGNRGKEEAKDDYDSIHQGGGHRTATTSYGGQAGEGFYQETINVEEEPVHDYISLDNTAT